MKSNFRRWYRSYKVAKYERVRKWPNLHFLFPPLTPPVQGHPDGGRKVCHNTTCEGEQALLSGSLVFVKLDFNGTAEGALFIGGVQSFGDIPVT